MIHVLFVDDEQRILDGLRRMLRFRRGDWRMDFALGGEAALERVASESYHVVVTDMRMPGMDGVELLSRIQERSPESARVVLSGQTDSSLAARAARVAHQFLAKPSSPEAVCSVVDRISTLQSSVPDLALRQLVGRVDSVPVLPRHYDLLTELVSRPDVPPERISEIMEADPFMAAKALQVVNSSFFGLSREIASVAKAVQLLGPVTIRELVVTGRVFHPCARPASGPSPEELQQRALHATRVPSPAAQGCADVGVAPGLLHGLAEWLIADGVLHLDTVDPVAPGGSTPSKLDQEEEQYRVQVGQISAYLLGLWNLPGSLVGPVPL